MVLASAADAEGDQLYPRKWNHDFIGLPIVRKEEQHRPTVTGAEVEHILASTKRRYAMLFVVPAGTGLRIGEALGLKVSDLSPDCRVLYVRRAIWRGKEQSPEDAKRYPRSGPTRTSCPALAGRICGQGRLSFRHIHG